MRGTAQHCSLPSEYTPTLCVCVCVPAATITTTTTTTTPEHTTVHLSSSNPCPSSAQNERGAPYSASSWTSYIETIFERHTQKRIGPTMLRSIFVTHCEKSNLSEADKESMATAMRHSRRAVSKHSHMTSISNHLIQHPPTPANLTQSPLFL